METHKERPVESVPESDIVSLRASVDEEGMPKTIHVTRHIKKVVQHLNWNNILTPCGFGAVGTLFLGGLIHARHKKANLKYFFSPTLFIIPPLFTFFYCKEVLRVRDAYNSRYIHSYVSGTMSGFILGALLWPTTEFRKLKVQRLVVSSMVGGLLGVGYCYATVTYQRWLINKLQREEEKKAKLLEEFKVALDRYGPEAYNMKRFTQGPTWAPSWWPLRSLPDKEYEKLLTEQILRLEVRKRTVLERLEEEQQN